MAKKKRKSSKRNPEVTDRNKRIVIGSAVIIGGVSVFVGSAMGIGKLDDRASQLFVQNTRTSEGEIAVEIVFPLDHSGASWMPRSERERLSTMVSDSVRGMTPLTNTPLQEVGERLAATGWTDGLPKVRWMSDGHIEINASWRAPIGAVRVGSTEVLIDHEGALLPLEYAIGKSNQTYFINTSEHPPKLGQVWGGEDLRDGIALLMLLEDEGLLEQVEGIDLGAGRENGTLTIRTNRGAKIVWGGGPGHDRPGEQPTSVKANRLKALFERTGRIDGNVELVDIRGANITLLRREG